ncbi:DUF7546 family protein [Halosegnis marinus]|uniref:ABC transporter ATP-binding protein n=1 Tax=Halosegnis marinus TaxID=3034023 RepID=A0ABD5ZRS0_9EURY|nr:hypothetical protein [Halosegnis sp. DT85]
MNAVARYRPDRRTTVFWAAVVNAELLVLLLYFAFVTGVPRSLRFAALVAVPWVWVNAAVWAYRNTEVPAAPRRRRRLAGALAVGYFLLLARVGGLVLPGLGDLATGLRVVTYQVPPGFGPAVLYSGEAVVVNLIPYQTVGYLALAWLVYATVVDVSGSAAAGVVGLFSCVSCAFPVITAVVSTVTGGATFAATIGQGSYVLSTAVFVLTVALLRWRPGVAEFARLRRALGR